MKVWRIAGEERITEGHGQTGLGVLITNDELPIRVEVAIPMGSDEAVRKAAEYVCACLNLG